MSGYWQAPESAAESFNEGFFRTGDLGEYDEAGFLCIAGRKKELIIVGGSNVLPGEVERGLAGQEGVEALAVCGIPDPDRGEVVGAFVVTETGANRQAVERRLRDAAEANLAAYKRPRLYRFVSELPRNTMGKIDRRALARA